MKFWRVSWAQIVSTKIHEISWDFSCMQKYSLFYNSIYCSCLDNDLAWLKEIHLVTKNEDLVVPSGQT